MSQEGPSQDWLAFAVGSGLLVSMVVVLLISVILLGAGISKLSSTNEKTLNLLILAAGMVFVALLLSPGIIINYTKFFKKSLPHFEIGFFYQPAFIMGIGVLWAFCVLAGTFVINGTQLDLFILPFLNIFGISLPILLIVLISIRNLGLPSARKLFSVFGANLLFAPVVALILEGLMVGFVVLTIYFVARINPAFGAMIDQIPRLLAMDNLSPDQSVRELAQFIFSPGPILFLLAIFSIGVPIIEESAKVFILLPILNKVSPQEGFVLGIVCGAAFALVENIGFAGAGGSDWVANTLMRSTAALPHIFNSGLLGLTLVDASRDGKAMKLVKAFWAAILIHGTWNAISLGLALNPPSALMPNAPILFQSAYPWLGGLALLIFGLFTALWLTNRQIFHLKHATKGIKEPEV